MKKFFVLATFATLVLGVSTPALSQDGKVAQAASPTTSDPAAKPAERGVGCGKGLWLSNNNVKAKVQGITMQNLTGEADIDVKRIDPVTCTGKVEHYTKTNLGASSPQTVEAVLTDGALTYTFKASGNRSPRVTLTLDPEKKIIIQGTSRSDGTSDTNWSEFKVRPLK